MVMTTVVFSSSDDYASFLQELDDAHVMLASLQRKQTNLFSPGNTDQAYTAIAKVKRLARKQEFVEARRYLSQFYVHANNALTRSDFVFKQDRGLYSNATFSAQDNTVSHRAPKVVGTVMPRKTVEPVQKERVVAPKKIEQPIVSAKPSPKPKVAATQEEEPRVIPFAAIKRSSASRTVVVKPGDSLMKIARKLGKRQSYALQIYKANKDVLPNANTLEVGQRLVLP